MATSDQLLHNVVTFSALHRGPVREHDGLVHLESVEPDFRCTLVRSLPAEPLPRNLRALRVLPEACGDHERLAKEGFRRAGRLRHLFRDLEPALPEVPGLQVRPAADLSELTAFTETQTRGFLMPGENFATWFALMDQANRRNFPSESQQFLVGWWEGRAASVGHVLYTERLAGVYALTTLEEYRRRGFTRAVVAAALRAAAARGCEGVTLQVYQGLPAEKVYAALGFSVAFDAEVWTRK
jgi:GNAT superfamily N-acetyltransferase